MYILDNHLYILEIIEYAWIYSEYKKFLKKYKVKRIQRHIPAWIYFKKQSSEYGRALNKP